MIDSIRKFVEKTIKCPICGRNIPYIEDSIVKCKKCAKKVVDTLNSLRPQGENMIIGIIGVALVAGVTWWVVKDYFPSKSVTNKVKAKKK